MWVVGSPTTWVVEIVTVGVNSLYLLNHVAGLLFLFPPVSPPRFPPFETKSHVVYLGWHQICCVAKDDLQFLIFLLPPP